MAYDRQGPWPPNPVVEDDRELLSEWDKQIWAHTAGVFNLLEYGASGTGSSGAAADHAAMLDAIADANAAPYGGTVYQPPGDYYYQGGYVHDPDVHVVGAGYGQTTINHTGNNALFTCLDNLPNMRHSYSGFFVFGNSGASAEMIHTGNAYGVRLHEVGGTGYTGNNWLRLDNTTAGDTFTEGVLISHCKAYGNLRNIRCERNGGTDSLSDMRIVDCQISQDLANSVGISLGDNLTWYGGSLRSKMHGNHHLATAVDVGAGTHWQDCDVWVVCESYTSTDATAPKGGVGIRGTATSFVRVWGRFQLYGPANSINHSMPSGSVFRVLGPDGGVAFKGDANTTLEPDIDPENIIFDTLTANRIVTLGADKLWGGKSFRVFRNEDTPTANTLTIVDGQTGSTLFTFPGSVNQAKKFHAGRNSFFYMG